MFTFFGDLLSRTSTLKEGIQDILDRKHVLSVTTTYFVPDLNGFLYDLSSYTAYLANPFHPDLHYANNQSIDRA